MPKGKTSSKDCQLCGKSVSLFAYNRHVKSCKGHVKSCKGIVEKKQVDLICQFCGEEFNRGCSVKKHEKSCKENPNRIINHNQHTKAKEEGREYIVSDETRKKLSEASKKQVWSEERRKKLSMAMKKAVAENPESYSSNNVCGRTKIQEYNGHKFHGSWEVVVAKWLDNHGVEWERDINPFPYFWEGNWRNYFPDFYLPDYDLYIEVKGYETERDRAKWASVKNLFVMKKKEIEKIRYNCSVDEVLGR